MAGVSVLIESFEWTGESPRLAIGDHFAGQLLLRPPGDLWVPDEVLVEIAGVVEPDEFGAILRGAGFVAWCLAPAPEPGPFSGPAWFMVD